MVVSCAESLGDVLLPVLCKKICESLEPEVRSLCIVF